MLSHSSLGPAHLVLHKAQKQVVALLNLLGDWAAFIGAVLILGLVSSWYMIDRGALLTTERDGPWVSWTSAGRADADPYTRAHFARLGTLQLTTEISRSYVAYADSDGGKSIICLRATTVVDGKRISTIVADLPHGTRVTTPRHHVQWIVTEYGAANLSMLTDGERGPALAAIAHPDFRQQLRTSPDA